ncbi:DoxX family membrane protein [Mucilaginibacter pocheonensis]|uniref:Membrane protein YphA (DoxX/SURF4 family) n=1 Tax=Mucilaginibacter pocheonensis TaxID=398050 RepID=A0ABU1TE05_9SPHI|nr:DoxX family membrane protein [Mucilaginibacter pocheonensis]MDR6943559.1 putative membrane protein YphA (DoxX/SURF4 family) [Mucilaginibacter pocheonensis]
MKIAVIIVRILVGLMFLFSSIVVLFKLVPTPELKGGVKVFMEGINASGYLLPFIKITELVCSIAFITGRFVTLATVLIFPVMLNIVLFHAFLDPAGLPTVIALLIGVLFLAYANRKNYAALFAVK